MIDGGDLTWMTTALQGTRHSREVLGPYQLPPGIRNPDGTVAYSPHALLIGSGIAIAHRGQLPDLIAQSCRESILEWAARTLWLTEGMHALDGMSLDGLERWCELPETPTKTPCPRCNGSRFEPDSPATDDGMQLACAYCDGNGYLVLDGFAELGGVTVDRRMLKPLLPHLKGGAVAVCVAPAVGGDGMDLHLRDIVSTAGTCKVVVGQWRLALSEVDADLVRLAGSQLVAA